MPERFVMAGDLEIDEIAEIAYALEWGWAGTREPPESPNLVTIYQTLLGATVLYVEDEIIGVSYFLINGPHREEAKVELLRTMRLVTREEIIAEAEQAKGFDAEAEAGRRLLAVAGDTFDARIFALLKNKFFANPDPRIRADMVLGFSYVGWEELRPLLEDIAASDPSSELRGFAAKGLAAWGAERTGKPLPS